jgi:aminopeptidase YwaD
VAAGDASGGESYAQRMSLLRETVERARRSFPPAAVLAAGLLLAAVAVPVAAVERPGTPPPLLAEAVVDALAGEVSGTSALHTAQELSLHHRQRGSTGFHAAAEAVRRRLVAAGLEEVEILTFPADGEIFYGSQRSRPAWDAEHAELWELAPAPDGAGWVRALRVASWQESPITLAQDSASGEATADLVDVGIGTDPELYARVAVAGKLVLTSSQPEAVAGLAVGEHGAAGIVSWAQNQRSAWWGEDESLVRWGHLGSFPAPQTFAFMVSPAQAATWRGRLAAGETVRLEARVEAGQRPGSYEIVTAAVRGGDPSLAHEEIAFSCHLDHPRPGANDNASGCATILETARALARLVAEGRLPRPRRTLRFYWPAEIEGTQTLLAARPEVARRTLAAVHMDMVGGDAAITKAVFHVTATPASLPTIVDDVAAAFARFVDDQSAAYSDTGEGRWPLVEPGGGKEALRAAVVPFTMGSDHQVWSEGSYRVPAVYLNDWPDRYIHTDRDVVGNLDPTKLRRAAFLGASIAYALAGLGEESMPAVWGLVRRGTLERTAAALGRAGEVGGEAASLLRHHFERERAVMPSAQRFGRVPPAVLAEAAAFVDALEAAAFRGAEPATAAAVAGGTVLERTGEPVGPLAMFGYDWLLDHLDRAGLARPALLDRRARWGGGGELAYEALNLVDGTRTVTEIADALAATYGPLPAAEVADFLDVLGSLGVVRAVDRREGTSLLGTALLRPSLPLAFRSEQRELLDRARRQLEARPGDPEAWVWVGRRLAYLGHYRDAIELYTEALAAHPDSAPLLRHRGHRYLTLRRLDEAVADLERAAELVAGRPDVVEPDGLPNAADRPTSTLQTNVFYHLGLAHYLRGELPDAIAAWRRGLDLAGTPDMRIATTYWLYLALARAGEEAEAAALLAAVPSELDLLESHDYHALLLSFRGERKAADLLAGAEAAGGVTFATVGYGLGASRLLAGEREPALEVLRGVVASDAWAAFGFLAAEADLARVGGE